METTHIEKSANYLVNTPRYVESVQYVNSGTIKIASVRLPPHIKTNTLNVVNHNVKNKA